MKNDLEIGGEIISKLIIPQLGLDTFCATYKVSKRADDDIAIVNSAFCIKLSKEGKIVDFNGAFGGMGPVTRVADFAAVVGKSWDDSSLTACTKNLNQNFALPADVPGGSGHYRTAMTGSFLTKFFFESRAALLNVVAPAIEDIGQEENEENYDFKLGFPKPVNFQEKVTNIFRPHRKPFSKQEYPESVYKVVGKGAHMNSAKKHVTGTSKYLDDHPYAINECFMAPVQSQRAHAKIVSIDYSEALKVKSPQNFAKIDF